MKITCVSDLHGFQPDLPGGDLLIIAGDMTARDKIHEWKDFYEWLKHQDYNKKIYIAGNHDGFLTHLIPMTDPKYDWIKNIQELVNDDPSIGFYLRDSGIEYEGVKIWGSPWTPAFLHWYFMKNRGADIRKKWDLIPKDTEILITHGPAYGLCDQVPDEGYVGCDDLREIIDKMPNLRLHVFGHIHEGYGTNTYIKDVPGADNKLLCVNASIMDANYNPTNKPIHINYTPQGAHVI